MQNINIFINVINNWLILRLIIKNLSIKKYIKKIYTSNIIQFNNFIWFTVWLIKKLINKVYICIFKNYKIVFRYIIIFKYLIIKLLYKK